MRAIVVAAALLGCLSGPCSAYEFETAKGQAVCDTLAKLEEPYSSKPVAGHG